MAPATPYPLNSLVLIPATDEQTLESMKRWHPHWGKPLSWQDFLEASKSTDSMSWAASNMNAWVLAPASNPTTLDFPSSCRTYRRRAVLAYPASPSSPNPTREILTVYGVASVFSDPAQRSAGYARRMMELLHRRLAPAASSPAADADADVNKDINVDGFNDAAASMLYSDVGEFYSSIGTGWKTTSPLEVRLDLTALDRFEDALASGGTVKPDARPLKPLTLDGTDWAALASAEARLIQRDVVRAAADAEASSSSSPARPYMALLPDDDVLLWHFHRTMRYFRPAGREVPEVWGAEIGSSSSAGGEWAFIIWVYDLAQSTLHVLRLRASTPSETLSLLAAAFDAGKKQGMKSLTAWNVDKRLLNGTALTNAKRDLNLPALAWYGDGQPAEWLFNERIFWC